MLGGLALDGQQEQSTESCVMNSGHSTDYFPLKLGTRQGDPLSAYLFILALVMLIQ